MKQKRFKIKPVFWVLAVLLVIYLAVPAFLPNLGLRSAQPHHLFSFTGGRR